MRLAIGGVIAGMILGVLTGWYLFRGKEIPAKGEVETRQISGEKIEQKDWKFKGNTITFRTEAQGKGVIETTIPKSLIPEVVAYEKYIHAVEATTGLEYRGGRWVPTFAGKYWRKMGDRLSFGGGPKGSQNSIGFDVAVMWAF
jgi:hypothetical protein